MRSQLSSLSDSTLQLSFSAHPHTVNEELALYSCVCVSGEGIEGGSRGRVKVYCNIVFVVTHEKM